MTSTSTKFGGVGAARRRAFAKLCLLVFGALGCADGRPPTYPVSGTVRFSDGSVVRTGYVEIIPLAGGPSARGKINQQGNFVIGTYEPDDGAAAGDYVALVLQPIRHGDLQHGHKLGPEHASHAGVSQVVSLKYSSRKGSDLACSVSDRLCSRKTPREVVCCGLRATG